VHLFALRDSDLPLNRSAMNIMLLSYQLSESLLGNQSCQINASVTLVDDARDVMKDGGRPVPSNTNRCVH